MKDGQPAIEHMDVTTDIPEDLKKFYFANQIQFKNFSQLQKKSNLPVDVWMPALKNETIKAELTRQGVEKPSLAFVFRWFYNDMSTKGKESPFFSEFGQAKSFKLGTPEQMMSLAYLSYLRLLGYLQVGEERSYYLFTELFKVAIAETSNQEEPQLEEIFTFFEMLRISFPNGEPLISPHSLLEFQKIDICDGNGSNPIRLLSRIFALVETPCVNDKALAEKMDFDSAQFCCLIKYFKNTWHNMLSVLLCRAFMNGKSTQKNQFEAMEMLNFIQKPFGLGALLIKSLLIE